MASWIPLRKFHYSPLPSTDQPVARPRPKRRRCRPASLRRVLVVLACTPVVAIFAILCQGIPPSYDDVRNFERRLPQHAVAALTRADGHPARYLRFPGHLWGHGLNNILQEALLMSYLAYVSNVSFVFEDYTWSHIPLPWTLYGLALRPARIPINAIISGPTAGGPMADAPLAVSAEYYQHVCSGPDPPYVISSADAPNDADGTVLLEWWRAKLASTDAQCIEVDSSPHVVFDRFFFGSPRVLSLLDPLLASPVLASFTWSPLVRSALVRNFVLLPQQHDPTDPSEVLPGLVAVHLRRGDYARHCPNLAAWGAVYMGVNQHPALPDRFDPSPLAADAPAREAYYAAHCLPSTDRVVARLREVRAQRPGLSRVYVLSNAWAWALGEVREALRKDGWADVASTADLVLDAEQYYVSMAVDMAIAERAEVFVGNGFSSLSSNVVMLRMARGVDPSTNRFL